MKKAAWKAEDEGRGTLRMEDYWCLGVAEGRKSASESCGADFKAGSGL